MTRNFGETAAGKPNDLLFHTGIAIALLAGEVANLLIKRTTVPVLSHAFNHRSQLLHHAHSQRSDIVLLEARHNHCMI